VFRSIKSSWLDKIFPWRWRSTFEWELKWWQKPFINFVTWQCNTGASIGRIYHYVTCSKDNKEQWQIFWKRNSIWKDLRICVVHLILIVGWFFLIDVLIWKFRRRFNLTPKPVVRVPSKPTNFLGEVDIMSDEWDNFINNLTDAQGIELMRLFELHMKGEVCITKLEDIVLKEESNGLKATDPIEYPPCLDSGVTLRSNWKKGIYCYHS